MTEDEWKKFQSDVTDKMKTYVKKFVTPLRCEDTNTVRLLGTGSYVLFEKQRILLTCEHVVSEAKGHPIDAGFSGLDTLYRVQNDAWQAEPHPKDIAYTATADTAWQKHPHKGEEIPEEKFSDRHMVSENAELLFLYGFAGENAQFAFEVHNANGSGYCTQEVKNSGNHEIFEVFWEPEKIQWSDLTETTAKKNMKHNDPAGFSGALVWNTRFLEMRAKGKKWTPDCAQVTGLVRRWDHKDAKTLLVWRIEHVKAWLNSELG